VSEALQRGLGVLGHLPDAVDNSEAPGVQIPLGVERLEPVRGAPAVRALIFVEAAPAPLTTRWSRGQHPQKHG
jgi:hypothetical protein